MLINVSFEHLTALKKESFSLVPSFYIDEINKETYVESISVLNLGENNSTFIDSLYFLHPESSIDNYLKQIKNGTPIKVPPCLSKKDLVGYIQSIFPTAKVDTIRSNEVS